MLIVTQSLRFFDKTVTKIPSYPVWAISTQGIEYM